MPESVWNIIRERAIDYLNICSRIYVFDEYAEWDRCYRLKVRVVCSRAYHCLFMRNMLIRPTDEELKTFGTPDFTIYNASAFSGNNYTLGMTSTTSVAINFKKRETVILGTEYASEMKKVILTVMCYLMPLNHNILALYYSTNVGKEEDVTLFFDFNGTGKTTLSIDPNRFLINSDEHCWTDSGIFNIKDGCYAKICSALKIVKPSVHWIIVHRNPREL
jgi:phosphoenolpyruvate carboxykinase (ATP)